ncbi:MAG: alpha-amylase family glycosyl hydrolase [Cyclobacteriaceae bacterium]
MDRKPRNWDETIAYEIFVQSFADSNGDGIGDLKGVELKLDYLADLGISAIWLMPINPSPSYHKYDVTDYYGIHPDYGTMQDLKSLIAAAHNKGIKVIIDLVVNHCSSQHPWFQVALKNPESKYRDYFIWKTAEETESENIATKEISADSDNINQWGEIEGFDERYFAFFSPAMPDLNYDNPDVRNAIFDVGRFWLSDVGVDGFRLDAAKHIYPENRYADNLAFWKYFRTEMEKVNPDVFLVGEVWDSAEVVAPFLKSLHSNFNFDLSEAIINSVKTGKHSGLIDKYQAINKLYQQASQDFVDATFLSNHDQNRVRSQVGTIKKTKLAASILLTLPGTPFIYYGEEIGMQGKKPDEYIREPFVWDRSDSSKYQTAWIDLKNNQNLVPMDLQLTRDSSVLNHYKALINLRNTNAPLRNGQLLEINNPNESILGYKRVLNQNEIQVFHNLGTTVVKIPVLKSEILFSSHHQSTITNSELTIAPQSSVVLKSNF